MIDVSLNPEKTKLTNKNTAYDSQNKVYTSVFLQAHTTLVTLIGFQDENR